MAYNYPSLSSYPNQLAGAPNAGISGLDIPKLLGQLGMSAGAGALAGGPAGAGLGVISGLLNMIPSIFKGIAGGKQLKEASQIESQNPRPNAEVAPAISQMVNYNRGLAQSQDIPGGEMYRNEIKGATSAGMNAASQLGSGSEAYGMLGKLMGQQNNAMGGLAQQTSQYVQGNQQNYSNSLGQLGQEQNRVWDWNKAQPYLQAAQMASQLRGSGMQNIFGGVSGAAGAGAEMAKPDFNSAINSGRGYGGQGGSGSMDDVMKFIQSLKG
jgi:hypothetical protein